MMPLLDEPTFELLITAHAGSLYRTAVWLGAGPQVAEDLVQDTLLRAWRARSSLRDAGKVRAWLVTILRREHARRFERWRPVPAEVDPDTLADPDGRDPAQVLAVREAVAALEPMYREPLVLQVVWGLSCDEIGAALELSTPAVETRLFRARQQVRARLEPGRSDVEGA